MSCYEWERGTIKLPSKDWAKFRTELLKAWDTRELARLEKAKTAHKALPKKKDLKLVTTSKDAEMYCDDGYVAFKNATRSLVWHVSENSHAREHAHKHWFAKLVFSAAEQKRHRAARQHQPRYY